MCVQARSAAVHARDHPHAEAQYFCAPVHAASHVHLGGGRRRQRRRVAEHWAKVVRAVRAAGVVEYLRQRVQRSPLSREERGAAKQLFLTEFAGRMGGKVWKPALEKYCKRLGICADTSSAHLRALIPLRCERGVRQWQWCDVREILERMKHRSLSGAVMETDLATAFLRIVAQQRARVGSPGDGGVTKAQLASAMSEFNLDLSGVGRWSRMNDESRVTSGDFVKCFVEPSSSVASEAGSEAGVGGADALAFDGDDAGSATAFEDDDEIENMVYAEPSALPSSPRASDPARVFRERMGALRKRVGLIPASTLRWRAVQQCFHDPGVLRRLSAMDDEAQAAAAAAAATAATRPSPAAPTSPELTHDLRTAFDDISRRFERDQVRVGKELGRVHRAIGSMGPLPLRGVRAVPLPRITPSTASQRGILTTTELPPTRHDAGETVWPPSKQTPFRVPLLASLRQEGASGELRAQPASGRRVLKPLVEDTPRRGLVRDTSFMAATLASRDALNDSLRGRPCSPSRGCALDDTPPPGSWRVAPRGGAKPQPSARALRSRDLNQPASTRLPPLARGQPAARAVAAPPCP